MPLAPPVVVASGVGPAAPGPRLGTPPAPPSPSDPVLGPEPPEHCPPDTGKVSVCVYLWPNYSEPIAHTRYTLLDEVLLVHAEGRTDEQGCMERRCLPLATYELRIEGYHAIGAMLLDGDDMEPLLRNTRPIDEEDGP